MNARQAAHTLEVIRTLMERTCQYQLLTARAGLVAGTLAGMGALSFAYLDAENPWQFGTVWAGVFAGSLLTATLSTIFRGRERGERIWSRQARAVLAGLAPSFVAAVVLSVFFFAQGLHLWLPGIWMLCYGQAALATSSYAPLPIHRLGVAVLLLGPATLWLGPTWAAIMMGLVFGLGHISLGAALLIAERRERAIRLYRTVA